MDNAILTKAQSWLDGPIDEQTKAEIRNLIQNDTEALTEAFYKDLEFGTGGLRGLMGPGTNRINAYTISMATQGLSNYLKQHYPDGGIKVAIAHDSRINSKSFARRTAEVFAANGIKVYLFSELRPTPELSFAIRHFGCQAGVVITASHNPKEYNGYKVYWNDGGQLVPPHDKGVITEVRRIASVEEIASAFDDDLIEYVGRETDEVYLEKLCAMSLSADAIKEEAQMGIVYTNLHGTGGQLIPEALGKIGFSNVITVPEQDEPDGNFPTVESPNPEEGAALDLAIRLAEAEGAELVMGTDPDTDRIGIAVPDENGKFVLLNGNQTAAMLIAYLLTRREELGKSPEGHFIAKTVVTSDLLAVIARKFKVNCYETLTGFKYIAELIRKYEGRETFIGGGEESYGYLIGDIVRDKDAVVSALFIAEMAAWLRQQGKSVYRYLAEVNATYGFYQEKLISIKRVGRSGAEEIASMMQDLRKNPPSTLNGVAVSQLGDYQAGTITDLDTGATEQIDLPSSNVIQFTLADGSKITARPSGTEPKIKFYFSVSGKMENHTPAAFRAASAAAMERIDAIVKELGL